MKNPWAFAAWGWTNCIHLQLLVIATWGAEMATCVRHYHLGIRLPKLKIINFINWVKQNGCWKRRDAVIILRESESPLSMYTHSSRTHTHTHTHAHTHTHTRTHTQTLHCKVCRKSFRVSEPSWPWRHQGAGGQTPPAVSSLLTPTPKPARKLVTIVTQSVLVS